MNRFKFLFALTVGKLCAFAVSIISKERGSNIAGQIALKFCGDFVKGFSGIDPQKTVFVTGTNGKSTTTNLIAGVFRKAGIRLTTNLEGANLLPGVATALIKNSSLSGKIKSEYMIFETDERFLPIIYRYIPAGNILVTNIQKDQVQRNGEPDLIYQKIRSVISDKTTLFLNNEEPRSKSLSRFAGKSIYFSSEKFDRSFTKNGLFDVSMACPVCGQPLKFEYHNVENIGKFKCSSCDYASEENADFTACNVDFEKAFFELDGQDFHMEYPTPHFVYNYAACIAVCSYFGIPVQTIKEAFADFKNVGGRLETIELKNKTINYIRMKQENPETLQSALDLISSDKSEKVFLLGLDEIKDFKPFYTNTFYAYDCDFKKVEESGIERYICFSEVVCCDAAERLIYAGVSPDKITVLPTNDAKAIISELEKCKSDKVYLITWLHEFCDIDKYVKGLK